MAQFSNSDDGHLFTVQCNKCIFGDDPCPIAYVQVNYNYYQNKNPLVIEILDYLVKNDGTCEMYKQFKDHLKIDAKPIDLFEKDNPNINIPSLHTIEETDERVKGK